MAAGVDTLQWMGAGTEKAQRTSVAILVVAALAFVLLRAPLLSVPLERDEGEYAYIAVRILEGDVPYRDAFDQKPPFVFLAYAVAIAVGGASAEAIRVCAALFGAATAWVLFLLVRRQAGAIAASFSVLVFAITASDPAIAATAANTEQFMLLPVVAAMYCAVRGLESERRSWWLACGAASAVACGFKQVAITNALFVAAVAAFPALQGKRETRAGKVAARPGRAVLDLAIGAALATAPVLLWFAAVGAFRPFLDAVLLHNLDYAGTQGASQSLGNLARELALQGPSFAVFWLFALAALAWPQRLATPEQRLLGGWLLASAVGVSMGLYFRAHYFVQLLPPLSALAGIASAGVLRQWVSRGGDPSAAPWRRRRGVGGLLVVLLAPPLAVRGELLSLQPDEISRHIYGMNPFPEVRKIAETLREVADPDDTIFVVGSEPQLFFYSGLRSASRFIFFYPLTGPYPEAAERQRAVLREVAAARPDFVVWFNLSTSLRIAPGAPLDIFDATRARLRREYELTLVALPVAEGQDYQIRRGAAARSIVEAAGSGWWAKPWISVYRLRSG